MQRQSNSCAVGDFQTSSNAIHCVPAVATLEFSNGKCKYLINVVYVEMKRYAFYFGKKCSVDPFHLCSEIH